MKMKGGWRLFRRVRFSLLLLLFLTGCRQEKADVSFMVFGDPAERQAYTDLVAAFMVANPDVRVELRHIPAPDTYRTRLATDFAAGAPPDVSLLNYRRFSAFAAVDLLEPLGPYVAESDLLAEADFFDVAVTAFTWQGQLVCLPQNLSTLVVYYNVDRFHEAGVPLPAEDWTWEDFVAAAQALTEDLDDDGVIDRYGLGLEPTLLRLAPFIWMNEGPVVDDQLRPTRLTLTRPPSLAALDWFVALHPYVPDRVATLSQDSESRFLAGTTAMYLNSRRGTPTYRENALFNWDVAPLPRGKTAATVLHSDGYCLARAAADKEAAWRFIEFANSFEGQVIVARSGRTVPSLRAVAESPAFLDPALPPANSQLFVDNAELARPVPVISTWDEIERVADQEITRAFYGEITVEEAAGLAVSRSREYFLLAAFAR